MLALHIRTKHFSGQRKVREHLCEECGRAFSTKRVLQSHLSKCDGRVNGVGTDGVEVLADKSVNVLEVVKIESFSQKPLGKYLPNCGSVINLLLFRIDTKKSLREVQSRRIMFGCH